MRQIVGEGIPVTAEPSSRLNKGDQVEIIGGNLTGLMGTLVDNHGEKEVIIFNKEQRNELLNSSKSLASKIELGQTVDIEQMVTEQQLNTAIYQPLIINKKLIGCLCIQHPSEHAFDNKQIEMFRTLTSYTAIAVENALGFTRLEELNKSLEQAHIEFNSCNSESWTTECRPITSSSVS